MPGVILEPNEWGQVMAILATAPWRDANPLLMKIGEQLRQHVQQPPEQPFEQPKAHSLDGNSKEAAP